MNLNLPEDCFLIQAIRANKTWPILGKVYVTIGPYNVLFYPDRSDPERETPVYWTEEKTIWGYVCNVCHDRGSACVLWEDELDIIQYVKETRCYHHKSPVYYAEYNFAAPSCEEIDRRQAQFIARYGIDHVNWLKEGF